MVELLESLHYVYQECLLSPHQFGIPNTRWRYFLMAKQNDSQALLPPIVDVATSSSSANLQMYLDESSSIPVDLYLEDRLLWSHGYVLDVVQPSSMRSCCFTKAYSRYIEGTGSVLQTDGFDRTETCLSDFLLHQSSSSFTTPCPLRHLRLRYFTPREIARLHGFPESFRFPPHITRQQCYRLLGNSLNVQVVGHVLHCFVNPNPISKDL
jgi:tRNA (cytosine38-C5)-methyltransferase